MNLEIKSEGELAYVLLALEYLPAVVQQVGFGITEEGMEVLNELKARANALNLDNELAELNE